MRKVLIALSSEELADTLAQMLGGSFEVTSCNDGATALQHLRNIQPYIMILDLMLPYKDGLTLLEDAMPIRPAVILGIVAERSNYIITRAESHGIGYLMLEPCEARAVVVRMMDMIACADLPPKVYTEPESEVTKLLLRLGFCSGLDGYTQLRVGIPLYLQDPVQRLSKELYPAIARLCRYNGGQQVEHSIRTAIQSAWETGNKPLWKSLFPNSTKAPTNRVFISRIAAEMNQRYRK